MTKRLSAFVRHNDVTLDPSMFTLNHEKNSGKTSSAIGVIRVTVQSAHIFKNKFLVGSPDPFVSIRINSNQEHACTKHRCHSYDPSWMETMFLLVNSLDQSLTLSVCDRHEHWKDTVLGSTTFQLCQLAEDTIQGGIHPSFSKNGKNRGELMFDVIYYPVLKPDEGQDATVGIVRLTIHEAKDFNRKSHSGRFNLFAKVSLGYNDPPIHCTQRFKDGANPVWESTHEFLCPDKSSSIITVKVINDNRKDPIVGYLSIRLDDLLDAKEWGSHWWPLSGCNTGMLMMSADWKSLNMRIS